MEHLDTFLSRWSKAGSTERANYQLFLTELCSHFIPPPITEKASKRTTQSAIGCVPCLA